MVRSQQRGGCTIVDWSLPEGEVGGVIVTVDVREQDLDPDDTRMTWCPVCHGASAMPGQTSGGIAAWPRAWLATHGDARRQPHAEEHDRAADDRPPRDRLVEQDRGAERGQDRL